MLWTPLHAQDVTLTSRDGEIALSGTLLTFDGEFYRLQTEFGELVLDGQGVLCRGVGCPNLEDYVAEFTVAGSHAIGDTLLPALLETYAARRGLSVRRVVRSDSDFDIELADPGTGFDVARVGFRLSDSDGGMARLLLGEADIAMTLREASEAEIQAARAAGLGDISAPGQNRILGLDALVPAVARGNSTNQITVTMLASMLAGAVPEWPATGGPVLLQGRSSRSGPAQVIRSQVLMPAGFEAPAEMNRHPDEAALSDAIARDPLALGMVRLSEIGNAVPLAVAGDCGMPVLADRQRLKSGDYPLTLPLFLYMPQKRLPLFTREFLAFLRSPQAQPTIRRAGFVDQGREEIPWAAQGTRLLNAARVAEADIPLSELKRMTDALTGARRLTTTFRFRGGASALEPQSAGNVADLAKAIESGAFDGRELLFVGFSDGEGDWQVNQRLSAQRARTVRDAVVKSAFSADFAQVRMQVLGFGEVMPMACDDAEWGRRVNRRVEVWVR
ncbi:phosphate ABC transporter substrate-binding/OmpA family protein [Actibacterium mucosum]|nr:phosphate ABC transporter substrate-binding/OmpA family protein [Actibacterium mucosum]